MQILVLEHLTRQTEKYSFSKGDAENQVISKINYGKPLISKANVKKIYREYGELVRQRNLGDDNLRAYLGNKNGKKFKGSETGKIFKHKLTDGDRIAYMWGEDLPFLRPEEKDSLILIGYSNHDDQGDLASIPKKQKYKKVEDILEISEVLFGSDLSNIEGDDFDTIVSLIIDSYNDSRTMYLIDPEKITEDDEEDDLWPLRLSDEQIDIIEKFTIDVKPLLVIGGAGTGKTVLAVHLLDIFTNNSDCIYFTQSRELLNKVINQYKILAGDAENNEPAFKDINEFCIEILKTKGVIRSRQDFIKTPDFLQYIMEKPDVLKSIYHYGLNPLDLWTEIRGVIKGSLDGGWRRNVPISMYDDRYIKTAADRDALKELLNKKLIKRTSFDKQRLILDEDPKGLLMSEDAAKLLQKIKDYFNGIDWSIEEISKEEYMRLPQERTMIETERREWIYSVYEKYRDWLHSKHYYDENDLIRMVMKYKDELQLFDFIIVDEVQDYTELQIRFIYELSKNKKGIVYAGDSNQIINPTVFDERRLLSLHEGKLEVETLKVNFRCQKEIVKLCNSLAEIRKTVVASGKLNRELQAEAIKSGESVVSLAATDENLNKIIIELLKYPNVAVLVADTYTKERLIKLVGYEIYEAANNNIIYEISEIKGMEYKYVFCYDIVSCFREIWEKILSQNKLKISRYRYYFNLFYVAVTRAEKYLCLMESDDKNLLNMLMEVAPDKFNYEIISDFTLEDLYINKLSNQAIDWIAFGDSNFSNGNYLEAKQNYINGGAPKDKIEACEAEIAVDNKDFRTAIRLFIKLDDVKRVEQYIDELNSKEDLFILAKIVIDARYIASVSEFSGKKMAELVGKIYEGDDSWMIYERLIMRLDDIIGEELARR